VVSENCYVGVGVKCSEKWNDKAEFSDIKFKLLVRGSVFSKNPNSVKMGGWEFSSVMYATV